MSENFGIPKAANDNSAVFEGGVESLGYWRALRAEATVRAEAALANHSPDFENLSLGDQEKVLRGLIESLSGDNNNRFIVKKLGGMVGAVVDQREVMSRVRGPVAA